MPTLVIAEDPVDLEVRKKETHRDLSDAALRSDLALGNHHRRPDKSSRIDPRSGREEPSSLVGPGAAGSPPPEAVSKQDGGKEPAPKDDKNLFDKIKDMASKVCGHMRPM